MLRSNVYRSFFQDVGVLADGHGRNSQDAAIFTYEATAVAAAAPSCQWGAWFAVEETCYYRMECKVSGSGMALLGVEFATADNTPLVADNYDLILASELALTNINYFRPPPGAVAARIVQQAPIGGEFVMGSIRILSAAMTEAVGWVREVLARLPLWPQMKAVTGIGESWMEHGRASVVVVGDSIMNDLCNGLFGALLQARAGIDEVKLVPVVFSCGNCIRFQSDATVKRCVLPHQPHLVVLGGVSHCYDLPAMRDTVRELRDVVGAPVLVLNDAVCSEDLCRNNLSRNDLSACEAAARVRNFNDGFASLGSGDGVVACDIRHSWHTWVAASGLASALLMRDTIHANRVGKMAFAAIVVDALTNCSGTGG